jgi:PEP-CTERM motif
VSVRRSKSRHTSRKLTIAEKLAQTYRHVPFRTRVAIAAALLGVCCIVILGTTLELGSRSWEPVATATPVSTPFWPPSSMLLPAGHSRAVYPYSIIAGGAESPKELKEAAAADPVVAQHYADFDITKAHRVTLDSPQLMYVSYRIGNKVFWTKHKLALRKGEPMLSDGHNMARTRCGNRVSVLPVRPNAPAEPTSSELDAPVFPAIVSSPYLAAYSVAPPALYSGPIPSPGGPGASFVLVAPFFPLPGGGGIVGSKSSSTPPPGVGGGTPPPGGGGGTPPPGGGGGTPPPGGGGTPPPVGVPEPGTAALVLIGLSAAAMRARRKRKAC